MSVDPNLRRGLSYFLANAIRDLLASEFAREKGSVTSQGEEIDGHFHHIVHLNNLPDNSPFKSILVDLRMESNNG